MYNGEGFNLGFARIKSDVRTALADVKSRTSAPSNRCNNCSTNVYPVPTLLENGRAGVDRIKIGIPFDPTKSDWKAFLSNLKKSPIGQHGRAVKVTDHKTRTRIEFFVWPGNSASVVYVEFNPSRYRDPTGFSLIHPNEVKTVVSEVIQTYFTSALLVPTFMVTPGSSVDITNWDAFWKSSITLSRLDATCDFHINDPEFNAGLLSKIRAKRSHGTLIAHNDEAANSWSNILKSSDGRMTFYNKAAQSKKAKIRVPAPVGTFRFEYRMEQRHLSYNHLHTLADLSEDRFEAALRHGWDLSRLSNPINKPGEWRNLIRSSALAHNEKAELIGFLEEDEMGDNLYFPDTYRIQMRKKARGLGITFKKLLADQGPFSQSLDLDAGDLVKKPSGFTNTLPHP